MEKRAKEEGECGGTGRKKKNEKKQMKRKQSMRKLLLRYQEEEELGLLRHLIIKYALKCCKNYPHFTFLFWECWFNRHQMAMPGNYMAVLPIKRAAVS